MSATSIQASLALGALSGWIIHPVLWPVGPFCWVARILATAETESGFSPTAAGDDGASVGPLQFKADTWVSVSAAPLSARTEGYASGVAAASYVSLAIATNWRYMLVYVPFFGSIYMREIWRAGSGSTPSWSEAWSLTESRFFPAYLFWRALGLIVEVPLLPLLLVAAARRRHA